MLYSTRQPITTANYQAAMATADPKPHITSTEGRTRQMSVEIMGNWLLSRPQCLESDIRAEFTSDEISRFLEPARQYAIRKSGDLH